MNPLVFWTLISYALTSILKGLAKMSTGSWIFWILMLPFIAAIGGANTVFDWTPSEESRLWDAAHSHRKKVPITPDLVQAYAGRIDTEYTQVTVVNNSDFIVNNVVMICKRHDAYENPPNNPHRWDDINYTKYDTKMMVMPHSTLSNRIWGHVLDTCEVEFKQYKPKDSDYIDFKDSSGFSPE